MELEAQEENARQQSEAIKAVDSGHVSVSDSSNPVLDSMSAMESQPFVAPSDGMIQVVDVCFFVIGFIDCTIGELVRWIR